MKRLSAILAICISCLAGPSEAATYYVDYVGGSDSNAGTSTGAPWKYHPWDSRTTGNANITLAAGDIVILKGGVTYVLPTGTNGFVVDGSGTNGSPIILDGDSGTYVSRWAAGTDRAILDGEYNTISHIDITDRDYITFRSLDMRRGGYGGAFLRIKGTSDHVNSYNIRMDRRYDWDMVSGPNKGASYMQAIGSGFSVKGSATDILADGLEIVNAGSTGVAIGDNAARVEVKNFTVDGYYVWGVDVAVNGTEVVSDISIHDFEIRNGYHYTQKWWGEEFGTVTDRGGGTVRITAIRTDDFWGFVVGDQVEIAGSASYDGVYTVTAVGDSDGTSREYLEFSATFVGTDTGRVQVETDINGVTNQLVNSSDQENPHFDGMFIRRTDGTAVIDNLQVYNGRFFNEIYPSEDGGTGWIFTSKIGPGSSIYIYNCEFLNPYTNDAINLGWNELNDWDAYVYHNTFALYRSNAVQITEYLTAPTHQWHFRNNLFVRVAGSSAHWNPGLTSPGTASALYGALDSDYNVFDIGSGNISNGTITTNSLATWQATTGDDANSIAGLASLVSVSTSGTTANDDLHLTAVSDAIGACLVLDEATWPGAATDADGVSRGTTGQACDAGAFEFTAEAPPTPTAPNTPAANATSSSTISFTWVDASSDEDGFSVETSPDNSTWTVYETTAANATSATITGLAPSTQRYMRVRAFNGAGASAYTTAVNATTSAAIQQTRGKSRNSGWRGVGL